MDSVKKGEDRPPARPPRRAQRRMARKSRQPAANRGGRFLAPSVNKRPNTGEADHRGTVGRRSASRFTTKPKNINNDIGHALCICVLKGGWVGN